MLQWAQFLFIPFALFAAMWAVSKSSMTHKAKSGLLGALNLGAVVAILTLLTRSSLENQTAVVLQVVVSAVLCGIISIGFAKSIRK